MMASTISFQTLSDEFENQLICISKMVFLLIDVHAVQSLIFIRSSQNKFRHILWGISLVKLKKH